MCLLMLASGVNTVQNLQFQAGAKKPGSGDLKLPNNVSQLQKCISKKPKSRKIDGDAGLYDDEEVKKARYKCTTCSKVFLSHQALGGHRASHNRVKGSFSQIENESLEEEITDEELVTGSDSFHEPRLKERTIEPASFAGKKTLRVYECSICHKVFPSGQALGGHKRCHWGGAGASDSISTISSNKETPGQQQIPSRVELLDLNLPALDDGSDGGNLNDLGGNAVNSDGASYAQTQSPTYLHSSLMGNYPKQGLLLYNSHTQLCKDDEADSKTGKEIGFGRECGSDIPMKAQSWLQL